MRIQVMVFWVMMPCSAVVGYQCFRVRMDTVWPSKMLTSCHRAIWCHNPEDHNLKVLFCLT